MWYVPIVTPNGIVWFPFDRLEPWERSLSASQVNAVTGFLGSGDPTPLAAFQDVQLAGHPLATDPADIEDLADRGDLDFDQFYWDPGKTP